MCTKKSKYDCAADERNAKKSKSKWTADERNAKKPESKWTAEDWRLIAANCNKNLIGSQQTVYCSGDPHQWQRTAVMCTKKSKSEWTADERNAKKSKSKWTADDWRLIAADRNNNWSGSQQTVYCSGSPH